MGTMKVEMLCAAFAGFAVLSGIVAAETPAPAGTSQEEAFLDVLPKIEVPNDIRPIPGAVNEEFRNCEALWPTGYGQARSGPEARALRDIYSFVRARNAIVTKDCGCSGKVATWDDVDAVAAALRKHHGADRLTWQHTEGVSIEARKLIAIAETMCAGSF